jgi:tetratricopeptide (TPR) repeat protein
MILLLYALHPIHTEVVASIKSRDTLLSAFFLFGALYLWLTTISRSNGLKVLSGILFFISLLSKEEGITFLAVVFLISYIFFKMSVFRSLKETVPFLLGAFAYLIIRSIVLDKSTETFDSVLNNVIYPLKGQERVATNLFVYLYYIKLLIFPFPLSVDYSFGQITPKTFSDGWVILSFIFFLFITVSAFKNLSKRTVIGFGVMYYLSTFSIFSNFTESTTIGATIGERFLFLPSIGFCTILVYSLYLLAKKINSEKAVLIASTVLLPVCLVYSVKSFSRTKVWADNITLFRSGIKTAPNSWRVHNNLAEAAYSRAKNMSFNDSVANTKTDSIGYWYRLAKTEFESAFDIIKGQNSIPHSSYMHYGEVLFKLKDTAGSKTVYQKLTTLTSNLSAAWFNLGTISYYEKDYASAVNYYQHALTSNSPDYFSTYKYLGASYLMHQDYKNSIQSYESALKYGSDKEITSILSSLYASSGNIKKVGELETKTGIASNEEDKVKNLINAGFGAYTSGNYRQAIQFLSQCESYYQKNGGFKKFPDFLNTWALSHLKLNEIGLAKDIFLKVIKENPKNYTALQNLGLIAYQNEKKYNQATEYFNRCLTSNSPDYYFTYNSLGFLYWIQNMPDKAIENFENALKYRSSKSMLNNLYQLWKSKGNQDKMNYYQALLDKQ